MIASQLGRMLLATSSSSSDEQDCRAEDDGGYGDLTDAIDRLIEQTNGQPDR